MSFSVHCFRVYYFVFTMHSPNIKDVSRPLAVMPGARKLSSTPVSDPPVLTRSPVFSRTNLSAGNYAVVLFVVGVSVSCVTFRVYLYQSLFANIVPCLVASLLVYLWLSLFVSIVPWLFIAFLCLFIAFCVYFLAFLVYCWRSLCKPFLVYRITFLVCG